MKIIPRSDLAKKHDIKSDLKRVVMTDTKEAREERAAIREQLGLGRNYKPIKRQSFRDPGYSGQIGSWAQNIVDAPAADASLDVPIIVEAPPPQKPVVPEWRKIRFHRGSMESNGVILPKVPTKVRQDVRCSVSQAGIPQLAKEIAKKKLDWDEL